MECKEKRDLLSLFLCLWLCEVSSPTGLFDVNLPSNSFHVHTNAGGSHTYTLVHHYSFEGCRCRTVGRSLSLSLSISISLSLSFSRAGHCKSQHARDGKGPLLLPWGWSRHVIRLIPHIGRCNPHTYIHTR